MLRHIFPFPRTPSHPCQEWLAPGGTPCGSTRMPLAEDFKSWSTWVDGFSQHWRFRSVSWGRKIHGTPNKSLRLGHAMVFEYLTFLLLFSHFLFLDCGWWGMKGCSTVRDVDFGTFRPPAAIISLGSRWLHVVDFTTFVGAVHQLKARSRDASRTWGLRMGWKLGTHPMVILPRWVMFSAKINRNPYIWTFPWGIIRVPGKDYRQPDGIVPPACPAERAEALADVVPSKQNRDWQADLCLKMLRK